MKILIFAETYYPDIKGGGEFSTKQMAQGLAGKGHEVVVRCLGMENKAEKINGVVVKRRYSGPLSEHFIANTKNNRIKDPFKPTDKIVRKRRDLYYERKWYEAYRSVIMKEKPDIVHTASPMTYLGRYNLWKAAFDLGIPVSHVCRGHSLLELKFLGGIFDRYNVRRNAAASSYLTALAAPSYYMLERHNRAGIRGQCFNDVIYNAVDFQPVSLSEDGMEQKEDLILYAGEIKKEKGIDTLIRAMEGLEGVRLLLIGKEMPEGFVKKDGKARVLDWMDREELYTYMKKAKAVVLPSEWNEPFGRILIEAVFNGSLGIGSDKGGIPEVLDHNKDYIFKSGDACALKSRIVRVLGMSDHEYMEEVKKLQKTVAGIADEAYIDSWERFFMQQIQ
ncbi:MAG: glycosyltransferase [Lachnospiraceae bacterium]|nr:glycosyltransferase [Lachnospiraceae bacterium]